MVTFFTANNYKVLIRPMNKLYITYRTHCTCKASISGIDSLKAFGLARVVTTFLKKKKTKNFLGGGGGTTQSLWATLGSVTASQ